MSDEAPLVLVRGAGDFASGIIHRLHRAGFQVVATELARPLAVRRRVAFSEAVHEGRATVEGVTAVRCGPGEIDGVLRAGNVALLVDPDGDILGKRQFDIVVDARSAKRNLGTRIDDAPIVVAIGPGFHAGRDCHAVVETLLGAGIGRVILDGPAADDSGGIPVLKNWIMGEFPDFVQVEFPGDLRCKDRSFAAFEKALAAAGLPCACKKSAE